MGLPPWRLSLTLSHSSSPDLIWMGDPARLTFSACLLSDCGLEPEPQAQLYLTAAQHTRRSTFGNHGISYACLQCASKVVFAHIFKGKVLQGCIAGLPAYSYPGMHEQLCNLLLSWHENERYCCSLQRRLGWWTHLVCHRPQAPVSAAA